LITSPTLNTKTAENIQKHIQIAVKKKKMIGTKITEQVSFTNYEVASIMATPS
jgi:hypothetical protein